MKLPAQALHHRLVGTLSLGGALLALAASCASRGPGDASGVVDVPAPPADSRALPEPVAKNSEPRRVPGKTGQWLSDEAAAREMAQKEKLPLLVDFRADWCAACRQLEKQTYPDAEVEQKLSGFVLVRVDATNEDDATTKRIIDRYGVTTLPTLVLIDSSGREIRRVNEFMGPKEFVKVLASVH